MKDEDELPRNDDYQQEVGYSLLMIYSIRQGIFQEMDKKLTGNESEENPRELAGEYYIDNEGIIREVKKQESSNDEENAANPLTEEQVSLFVSIIVGDLLKN